MPKTRKIDYRHSPRGSGKAERYITVRGERLDPPDYRKLIRAVIAMARREAEAEDKSPDTPREQLRNKEPEIAP